MAISPLVTVQNGVWVDLYAATSIAVGTQVIVQNFQSKSRVSLSDSELEPTSADGRIGVDETQFYQNTSGDLGLWAYCSSFALVSVQEVV